MILPSEKQETDMLRELNTNETDAVAGGMNNNGQGQFVDRDPGTCLPGRGVNGAPLPHADDTDLGKDLAIVGLILCKRRSASVRRAAARAPAAAGRRHVRPNRPGSSDPD
jgi:hypothetical protein